MFNNNDYNEDNKNKRLLATKGKRANIDNKPRAIRQHLAVAAPRDDNRDRPDISISTQTRPLANTADDATATAA
eukprot:7987804-Pyramimonas_sp.AAC.1